jgi:hypothetical protein
MTVRCSRLGIPKGDETTIGAAHLRAHPPIPRDACETTFRPAIGSMELTAVRSRHVSLILEHARARGLHASLGQVAFT